MDPLGLETCTVLLEDLKTEPELLLIAITPVLFIFAFLESFDEVG